MALETLQGRFLPPCSWQSACSVMPLFPIMCHGQHELCILHKVLVAIGPSVHGLRWTQLCSLDLKWANGPNLAQLELTATEATPQRILPRGTGPLASSLPSVFNLVMLLTLPVNSANARASRSLFLKDYASTMPLEASWIMTWRLGKTPVVEVSSSSQENRVIEGRPEMTADVISSDCKIC